MSNIEIIDSNHSAGVELVRSGDRWGVRIDDEIRWADGPIDAMRNYCEHVEADRELDTTPAPRCPVAGWVGGSQVRVMIVGQFRLHAHRVRGRCGWWVAYGNGEVEGHEMPADGGIEAAQLAAEDTMLELLRAGASALGYEVRRG